MECAPGNPLNMPMCRTQLAPDVARHEEDMAGFIVEAEQRVCHALALPICTWTYKYPYKESIKRLVCMPKTCTAHELEDAYANTTYHLATCQHEEKKCTLTILCPRKGQLYLYVFVLVVFVMGIVAFIVWRKHVNT